MMYLNPWNFGSAGLLLTYSIMNLFFCFFFVSFIYTYLNFTSYD